MIELDLSVIEPSLAGPRRPQDRVPMQNLSKVFREAYADRFVPETINHVTEDALMRLETESFDTGPDPVAQKEDSDRARA